MLGLLCPQLCCYTEIIGDAVVWIAALFHGYGLFPVPWFQTGVDLIHYPFPDPAGIGASVDAGHGPWDIITHPYSCGIVAGVAAEPGIPVAVCGSGLSGAGHAAVQCQSPSGTVRGGHGSF